MDTIKIEDSKKTIIAFAAGLLIGALLVWAFTSATPRANDADNRNTGENGLVGNNSTDDRDDEAMDDDADDRTSNDDDGEDDNAEETFSVDDQDAGNTVEIGSVSFPDGIGWVAVSDYEDGVAGRFLGAARYDTEAGLEPTEIELLRATEAGKTYRVSFFKDNGDMEFSRIGGDVEIEGEAAFFTAE